VIIGIGGVSRSGKSSLAESLLEIPGKIRVISLDDYTFPEDMLPEIKGRPDWEIPEAYDFDLLLDEIRKEQQVYDHTIIEGILIFYDPRINQLFDRRIFLTLSRTEFLKRRGQEDRWGPEPSWYLEYVWHSYEKYGRSFNGKRLELQWNGPPALTTVMYYLENEPAES